MSTCEKCSRASCEDCTTSLYPPRALGGRTCSLCKIGDSTKSGKRIARSIGKIARWKELLNNEKSKLISLGEELTEVPKTEIAEKFQRKLEEEENDEFEENQREYKREDKRKRDLEDEEERQLQYEKSLLRESTRMRMK